MQVRIANRQDEAAVRGLLEASGEKLEIAAGGADHDLHNLDQNYFGHDGIFLVAEIDGNAFAFAGARCEGDNRDVLVLRRMFLGGTAGDTSRASIKEKFLAIIKNHAYQMDCKTIEAEQSLLAV